MAYTDIDKPDEYFNTVLHTGDGASPKSITGFGFNPEFVWVKARSQAYGYSISDIVRGANKTLRSDSTSSEVSDDVYGNLTSFITDGYTATSGATNINYYNQSSTTYVNWGWKANGTGVSNTDGSITSTVSANTTSGFSIVTYTSNASSGSTVGHGLGVAPSVVIVKRRSSTEDWGVGHQSLGWTNFLRLNTTGASSASTGLWNDTAPSSTVFTLGNSGISNPGSSITMIAYCFAEKKGFSKFGKYTGNGSADGTFVYTGFKPAFILIKRDVSATNWLMYDNKRDSFNVMFRLLQPNGSAEEATADPTVTNIDFLSNGFKLPTTWSGINGSGSTYYYMCFAESPFVTSTGIPTTAR